MLKLQAARAEKACKMPYPSTTQSTNHHHYEVMNLLYTRINRELMWLNRSLDIEDSERTKGDLKNVGEMANSWREVDGWDQKSGKRQTAHW